MDKQELIVASGDFERALATLERVGGSSRNSQGNILIAADGQRVELQVHEQELAAKTSCAQTSGQLTAVVPYRRLRELVKLAGVADIRMTMNGTSLGIDVLSKEAQEDPGTEGKGKKKKARKRGTKDKTAEYQVKLPTTDPLAFPPWPTIEKPEQEAELQAQDFKKVLDQVYFAAARSADSDRFVMNCVHLTLKDAHLRAETTDGHRMALAGCSAAAGQLDVLIYERAVRELRVLLSTAQIVKVSATERRLFFEFDTGDMLATARVEGEFPDVTRIMPKEHSVTAQVDRDRLTLAVKRVAVVASERSSAVVLNLGDNKLTVGAVAQEAEAQDEVMGEVTGSATVAVSASLLLDFLAVVDTDNVEIQYAGERSPVVFVPFGDQELTYLISPMAV